MYNGDRRTVASQSSFRPAEKTYVVPNRRTPARPPKAKSVKPTAESLPLAVSPAQAATLLGCSRGTVDHMIDDGTLAAVHYGRRVFVSTDSLRDFATGAPR